MKIKRTVIALVLISLLGCNDEPKANLVVKGKLEGFRKGDLYLQKIEDTTVLNVDSIQFLGDQEFELKAYVEEPQLMFLYIKKFGNEADADYLDIFAEEGVFEFNLKKDSLAQTKAVLAPENHQKYETYLQVIRRFNDQNLALISEQINALKDDENKLAEVNKKFANLKRNKYLYTINYALRNPTNEIAPFLVLSEAYDVNKIYLDTVYNTLTPEVKMSKYGKQLKDLIDMRTLEMELDAKANDTLQVE